MLAEADNMNQNPEPARILPPGHILSRELDARSWTQKDLAEIMNRPPQAINEIIRGVKQITPEIAHDLSEALGTSPDFWANLEFKYRLHSSNPSKPSS
jgi:addiction module HigA family antidote